MKYGINRICALLVLALVLAGCNTADDTDYMVLEFDYSDSISGVQHHREYNRWYSGTPIQVDDVVQDLTITANGREMRGAFREAQFRELNNFVEYEYISEDNCFFAVDADGRLTYCSWRKMMPVLDGQTKLTQEKCLQIAKDFLTQYVDVELYRVDMEYDETAGEYAFDFTKYIGDYRTADKAKIVVHETGNLCSFYSKMLGKISIDTRIDFDYDKVEEAVFQKLDELYVGVKDNYDEIKYEIVGHTVTILEGGQVALVCYANVECITHYDNSTYGAMSENIGFVVRQSI